MRRLLVACDGSEAAARACEAAASLLEGRQAEVRLLAVLSFDLDPHTLLGEDLADTPERETLVMRAVERATTEPHRLFAEAGHGVEVAHRFGNPADEILADAEEWAPDLIVLGRRGLSRPQRWLLGSVSERVVRHAGVPVLVVT